MKYIDKQARDLEGKIITPEVATYIAILPFMLAFQPVIMILVGYASYLLGQAVK